MKLSEFIAQQSRHCWVVAEHNSKVNAEKAHKYWLYATAQRIGNGTTYIESDELDPEMPDYAIEEWNAAIKENSQNRLEVAFGFKVVRPK